MAAENAVARGYELLSPRRRLCTWQPARLSLPQAGSGSLGMPLGLRMGLGLRPAPVWGCVRACACAFVACSCICQTAQCACLFAEGGACFRAYV